MGLHLVHPLDILLSSLHLAYIIICIPEASTYCDHGPGPHCVWRCIDIEEKKGRQSLTQRPYNPKQKASQTMETLYMVTSWQCSIMEHMELLPNVNGTQTLQLLEVLGFEQEHLHICKGWDSQRIPRALRFQCPRVVSRNWTLSPTDSFENSSLAVHLHTQNIYVPYLHMLLLRLCVKTESLLAEGSLHIFSGYKLAEMFICDCTSCLSPWDSSLHCTTLKPA